MKRRIPWRRWFAERLRTGPRSAGAVQPVREAALQSRVVLRFRDGSSVMLDPSSRAAVELHRIADRWLRGQ